MKGRQRVAFGAPCAYAPDTVATRYRAVQEVRGLLLSSILTVNK